MAETRIVEIDRLGAQGDGVANDTGEPVFIAGALPGEQVEIATDGDATRLVRIVTPSTDRVRPPCRHFGQCGGCIAQHMSPALYRGWKRDAVVQAFAHRGLEAPVGELLLIAPATRRRVVLEARRTPGGVELGFHAARSHTLIDLTDCRIMQPAILQALPQLRQVLDIMLPARGTARVTVLAGSGGLDVAVSGLTPTAKGRKPRPQDARTEARDRARLGQAAMSAGLARLTIDGDIALARFEPQLDIGGVNITVPPGDFIQATAEAEAAMRALVTAAVGKAKRVADLYCGVGTFTFPLARTARVLAVDSAQPAIEALKSAASRAQGCKPIETRVRDLMHEPLSRKELEDFDAVVFDPPRAGAEGQSEALARSQVPLVVAISCNPATLARDCRILVDGGYQIEAVTPIDQFVWSAHTEAVAVLRRPRK